MSATYNVSTDIGKVRLLIPDRVLTDAVFQDDEISAFLSMEGDSVHRAAALGLETIASDTAATLRVTNLLGFYNVDGARASDALLKRAAELRKQADAQDAREGDLFDWADMVYPGDANSRRERLYAERLRSAF